MARHQLLVTIAFTGLVCLGACVSVPGAYLDQDYDQLSPPSPEPIVPPRPVPHNEISELISRVHIGRPWATRNLTIFPLVVAGPGARFDCKTLQESLSRGYIEVLEEKSPEVGGVLVRNNSPHHIFLMAGEAIEGGKQNRLISEDVLLGPHGRVVRVPVYCIEKGRWSEGEGQFRSGRFAAPTEVRKLAREKASQNALWDTVDGLLTGTRTRSENENLAAVYENEEVAREIASYRREMRIPLHRTVGCVVVVNGRIVGCDVFGSPELFENLWPKLLDSYALDAVTGYKHLERWPAPPSEEEVRRFLDRVFRASFRERSGTDLGRIVEISNSGIEGEGLVFRGEVVHAHLTPRREVRF